jgi:hypothetical protein
MNTHAAKSPKNKKQAITHHSPNQTSNGESTFQFKDNRQAAITQRKQQEAINNSPNVLQLKANQEMANNSPQVKQLKAFQAMADNMASQIVQRKQNKEEEILQGKFEPIQKKRTDTGAPNQTGLPDQLKSGIESLSGMSMDSVRVHYNSAKPADLQAHAYAQGSEIHLGPGQERHLPHEAWHVVQQTQGRVKPTMQMKGKVNINDDAGLEHEADLMGAKALKKDQSNHKSLQPKRIASSIVQRTVWEWNEKYWSAIRTEGMPTAKPATPGKYAGEKVSTGAETDLFGSGEVAAAEMEESGVKKGSKKKAKVPKTEYLGGGANDSHIHQYSGGFHLKLGKKRFNIVQNDILYRDKCSEAIEALNAITGDRAAWARQMITYINDMI